ncbi:MAG TPA: hypothetical protein VK203_14715 [Nostocaceae cyanobacterium]|nr:hypothetical protein [Nostocaceae cyanobacterium]
MNRTLSYLRQDRKSTKAKLILTLLLTGELQKGCQIFKLVGFGSQWEIIKAKII